MRQFTNCDHLYMVQQHPKGDIKKVNLTYYYSLSRTGKIKFVKSLNLVGGWWVKMKKDGQKIYVRYYE